MNDLEALAKTYSSALEPLAGAPCFVGSWAHRLYRFYPGVNVPAYQQFIRATQTWLSKKHPSMGISKRS